MSEVQSIAGQVPAAGDRRGKSQPHQCVAEDKGPSLLPNVVYHVQLITNYMHFVLDAAAQNLKATHLTDAFFQCLY